MKSNIEKKEIRRIYCIKTTFFPQFKISKFIYGTFFIFFSV